MLLLHCFNHCYCLRFRPLLFQDLNTTANSDSKEHILVYCLALYNLFNLTNCLVTLVYNLLTINRQNACFSQNTSGVCKYSFFRSYNFSENLRLTFNIQNFSKSFGIVWALNLSILSCVSHLNPSSKSY